MTPRLTVPIAAASAGAGVFAILRWLRFRRERPERPLSRNVEPRDEDALVDEASLESFPASDPPSWTLGEDRPS